MFPANEDVLPVHIRPIPVMPTTVAMPVWSAPMIGSPKAIKYAPIKHVIIPKTRMMFFRVFIIPPLVIYHILLAISNFMLDIDNIKIFKINGKHTPKKQKQ